jgi:drug/metabolite transporter (DMT)-like permease
LLSAAAWGGSDFAGGLGARHANPLLIVISGHVFTLLILLAVCLGIHVPLPGTAQLLYAAAGGFEGAFGLVLFYRALAMGAMGLTAALTGLLTALIPVLFSMIHEGLPAPLTAAGLALGLVAIWLIIRVPTESLDRSAASDAGRAKTAPTPLLFGALAGVAFGVQLILFKMASSGGALWTMTAARGAGVAAMLIALLAMPPKGQWRGFWQMGLLAGSLDTLGNLFYIQAARYGRLDVAALVCSLYPACTILLAAIFLREWPSRRQFAGIALALAAVALLSV